MSEISKHLKKEIEKLELAKMELDGMVKSLLEIIKNNPNTGHVWKNADLDIQQNTLMYNYQWDRVKMLMMLETDR